MQLIYRGYVYPYTATDVKPTRQPRAINWRYRSPGAAQLEISSVKYSTADRATQLQAINWRYQMPVEV